MTNEMGLSTAQVKELQRQGLINRLEDNQEKSTKEIVREQYYTGFPLLFCCRKISNYDTDIHEVQIITSLSILAEISTDFLIEK